MQNKDMPTDEIQFKVLTLDGGGAKGFYTLGFRRESLGALLKSARDIRRKDKGLNGDLGCGLRQD